MWICFHPSSSTVWNRLNCCPPLQGFYGDQSRSLRRLRGAPWSVALWSSAQMPTPRSAAALHPVYRQDLPDWSSASGGARRSRPTYNTASLFLSCTHADLHPHTNVSSWLQRLGVIPPLSVKPQVKGMHQSDIDVEYGSDTDAVKLAIITMGLGISTLFLFISIVMLWYDYLY